MFRAFSIWLLMMVLAACQSNQRKDVTGLSETDAQRRSERVSQVSYTLNFEIDGENPKYKGQSIIDFDLSDVSEPLTIDFKSGEVVGVKANGNALAHVEYNEKFITLPKDSLKSGRNQIVVDFKHDYSKTGAGFYRFKDPEDGNSYLYTDFEPYDSNQLFPQFDQPDLKADYELSVKAPKDWVVVSSQRETGTEKLGEWQIWKFPRSERFSTYIFSLHAGPYKVWESKAGKIPLRLMARQSFAKYMDYREWFQITRQGFQYFGEYFDYPYPFKKYDQLIVPDFNAGAMENVAAVTFREGYMPRGKPTRAQRERRANVILHEMAHMWFGNLVTMKWWDDLWLNESFATYMAFKAATEATEFKQSWETFFDRTKAWAYWEDDLVTTHPIVAEVPGTEQAFANFDGITYGKGASTLKQLAFFLGEENFKKGIQNYFKKYAWKNTRMKDFLGALGEASNTDLSGWTQEWLLTSNHNRLEVRFHCEDGRISSMGLVQTAPEQYPTLRTHRTVVGLYAGKSNRIVLQEEIPVTYSGKHTFVSPAVGKACPILVYPNQRDMDFVKVKLDPRTLSHLKSPKWGLGKIRDDLGRMMFFQSLWDMVRDTNLSAWEYAELAFRNLPQERNIKIATRTAGRLSALPKYLPEKTAEQKAQRQEYLKRLERFSWDLLGSARPHSDFQKLWFDTFVSVARTDEAQAKLKQLLNGQVRFRGLTVDQDRRWNIVQALHRRGYAGSDTLREEELKRDSSEQGAKEAIAALVLKPDLKVKREWFGKVMAEKSDLPLARLKVAMENLFPEEQDELTATFMDEYYKALPSLAKTREDVFLTNLTEKMTPVLCETRSVNKLNDFISSHQELSPVVMKALRIAHQEEQRCVGIREKSGEMVAKAKPDEKTDNGA